MKCSCWIASATASAALLFAGSGQAAVVTYQFGDILAPAAGNVDPSVASLNFATLTVTDDSIFKLTADDLSVFGPGAFLSVLAVETPDTGVSVTGTTAGGGVSAVGYSNGGGPGGSFDFHFVLGLGSDTLTDGESVEWTVSGLSSFNLLGLHVKGIDPTDLFDEQKSAWYAPGDVPSPVPLPAAFWLFGTSLAGLLGLRKHRQARSVA